MFLLDSCDQLTHIISDWFTGKIASVRMWINPAVTKPQQNTRKHKTCAYFLGCALIHKMDTRTTSRLMPSSFPSLCYWVCHYIWVKNSKHYTERLLCIDDINHLNHKQFSIYIYIYIYIHIYILAENKLVKFPTAESLSDTNGATFSQIQDIYVPVTEEK